MVEYNLHKLAEEMNKKLRLLIYRITVLLGIPKFRVVLRNYHQRILKLKESYASYNLHDKNLKRP